jgi:hypothetical protein
VLLAGLTEPGEVGEVLALYRLKSITKKLGIEGEFSSAQMIIYI